LRVLDGDCGRGSAACREIGASLWVRIGMDGPRPSQVTGSWWGALVRLMRGEEEAAGAAQLRGGAGAVRTIQWSAARKSGGLY